jgi:hypothetical protein
LALAEFVGSNRLKSPIFSPLLVTTSVWVSLRNLSVNRISIGPHQAPERVPLLAVEEAVVGEEVWRGVEAGAEEGAAEVPFSRAEEGGEDGGGGLGRGCGTRLPLEK